MRRTRSGTAFSFALAAAAGLVLAVPAAAAVAPVRVDLGVHRFGHLATPATVVARAKASQVGWQPAKESSNFGPWSFDVARDGSIWLLDEVNNRLLRWNAGQPATVHYVKLPYKAPEDFAVAANGSLYALDKPAAPDHYRLYALSGSGVVRWSVDVEALDRAQNFNNALRFGPDNTLYEVEPHSSWTPLTTPAGAPLTIAQMRDRRLANQPLPGGYRLTTTWKNKKDATVSVSTAAGRVTQAWHITSRSPLWADLEIPAWVGGTPVMSADVSDSETGASLKFEKLVLRLPPATGQAGVISLDFHATWGDTITTVRMGPDGYLYQLHSDPSAGVSIARFALPKAGAVTPAPSPSTSSPSSTTEPTPTATAPTSAPPTTATTPTGTPTSAVVVTPSSGGGTGPLPWILGTTGALSVAAAGAGLLRYRHLHGHVPAH